MRVVIEAGSGQGWYQLLTEKDHLVSVESFGASGPGSEVYQQYGFKAEEIASDILAFANHPGELQGGVR